MLRRLSMVLLLALAACSHEQRVVRHRPIPVPLVYLPGVNPATAAEHAQVESRIPPGMPPVWFILITANTAAQEPGGAPYVAARIYFIPDRQAVIRSGEIEPFPGNPILREGRYLRVTATGSTASPAAMAALEYVQVPYASRAPNPVLVPSLAELPFSKPAGIPDDTLVELILLARSTYETHRIPPDAPILAIDRSPVLPNVYLLRVAAGRGETRTLTIRQYNGYFTIDP